MRNKFLLATLVGITFVMLPAGAAKAAYNAPSGHWAIFEKTGKYWYALDNTYNGKKYLADGVYTINGVNYAFDSEGYLAQKGWYVKNGYYYMINSNGTPITGWMEVNGDWYYFDPENEGRACYSGWKNIGGYDYYFYSNCKLATNTTAGYSGYNYDKGYKEYLYYLLGDDGRIIYDKGWHYLDDKCYYVTNTGKGYVLTNQWVGDSFLNSSGEMATRGDYVYQGKWNDQIIYTSSQSSSKYDYETSKYLPVEYTGVKYQFTDDGRYVKGWYRYKLYGSENYGYLYSDKNGNVYDGWLNEGKDWYYINNGQMISDSYISKYSDGTHEYYTNSTSNTYSYYAEDGKRYSLSRVATYRFAEDGKMITGWYQEKSEKTDNYFYEGDWYYSNKSGVAYNGWLQSGSDYYAINKGVMLRDTVVSYYVSKDGKYCSFDSDYTYDEKGQYVQLELDGKYYLDEEGKMLKGWHYFDGYYNTGWRYAGSSGRLIDTGWAKIGGKDYYFNNGYMRYDTEITRYVSEDGSIVQYNNSSYYDEAGNYINLKSDGSYYLGKDGDVQIGWIPFENSDGTKYYRYAHKDGLLAHNEWVEDGGKYYYIAYSMITNSSVYQYGSYEVDAVVYDTYGYSSKTYTDASGKVYPLSVMNRFYVNKYGEMVTGWIDWKNGDWSYAKSNGNLARNEWISYNGDYYFIDGYYLLEETTPGDVRFIDEYISDDKKYVAYERDYTYDKSGNRIELNYSRTFAIDHQGKMLTGWFRETYTESNIYASYSDWYYAKPNGALANGWEKIGNDWYLFDDGNPVTGPTYVGEYIDSIEENYLSANPIPVRDPRYETTTKSDEKKLYQKLYDIALDEWEAKHAKFVAENTYVFDQYGKLSKGGWVKVFFYGYGYYNTNVWFYADKNGHPVTGWIKDGGKDYYIDHGYMVNNEYVDGYFLGPDGACV